MAEVDVHIWYDGNGRIVAIGQGSNVVPVSSHHSHALATKIDDELVARLHRTHRIDVANVALVRHETDPRSS